MSIGTFSNFFQDEKSKEMIKNICIPISTAISEQFYVYIVIFCVYNVLLFIFVLIILMVLLHLTKYMHKAGLKVEPIYY